MVNIRRVAETQMVNIRRVAETQMVNIRRVAETQMVNIRRVAETQMVNIRRVAETQMVSVRKRNIQGRYNSLRHLQRRYLNRIEYISGTKFIIITIFYNVYSKYNIPRKGQGKSTRDYRGLTNLRFSFARHQQSLLITHFPVKFILIQNKSVVSKHWISVANAEC